MLQVISLFVNEALSIEAKRQQILSNRPVKNLYFQTELLVSTQTPSSFILVLST